LEVAKVRRQKALIETYAHRQDLKLLQYDDFARYCVKMATGSGKTKVIALAMAWQFFNAVAEARDDYAKTFLLIAPNVIVFERLRSDFAGGRILHADPVIPDDLRTFWGFQCYMRGDAERAGSLGALYVTNVQQLYDRPAPEADEPEEMTAVLGPRPPAQAEVEDFAPRVIARGGPVAVLNDEAHHTHDEESEWNKCVRRLHATLTSPERQRGGSATDPSLALGAGVIQFDFAATPRHTKGQLFSWTVYDYPLKQAILDNIVKRPLKGIAKGIQEQKSEIASTRYQAHLAAGVERWKEYRDQLAPLSRKPVLFVMMNETSEADDVGDWLQRKNATLLTGVPWCYLKVRQTEYTSLQPTQFADLPRPRRALAVAAWSQGRFQARVSGGCQGGVRGVSRGCHGGVRGVSGGVTGRHGGVTGVP
jgi:type III restriction enzyme